MSLTIPQNFFRAKITRAVNVTTATNIYLDILPVPTAGWLVINPGSTILREIIHYTSLGSDTNGTYIVVDLRGLGSTTAQVHSIGEPVRMNLTSLNMTEIDTAINSIVAGGVVVATGADVNTGTDNTKVVTPLALASSGKAGEWSYLSKVTYTAESGAKTFSSLSVHDNYKLIFRLYNTSSTDLTTRITLNNITSASYVYSYIDLGSGGWANSGSQMASIIYQNTTSARAGYLNTECILEGTHKQGYKGFYSTGGTPGNATGSDRFLAFGGLASDSNDLSRIDVTVTGVCSGTVELWYKDAK